MLLHSARGAARRGPSLIQISRPESALPAAAQVPGAERRKNQKMAQRCPLRLGQSRGGGVEEPCRSATQPFQIRLQSFGGRGCGQIRILDARREQFIDREYYTAAKGTAPVIGDRFLEILRGAERRDGTPHGLLRFVPGLP